jgi:hypothetical protein
MSSSTPVSGIPYALLTDTPNANTLAQNIASAIDHLLIPKYASTTARDAANTSPSENDMAAITAAGYTMYDGSAWRKFAPHKTAVTFTPVWTTSTGSHSPSIGNGVYNCQYIQMGLVTYYHFQVTFGSTTNFNSGTSSDNWNWTMPVTPNSGYHQQGIASLLDASTPANNRFSPVIVDSSGMHINDFGSGTIDAVTPFTWAVGDSIECTMVFIAN